LLAHQYGNHNKAKVTIRHTHWSGLKNLVMDKSRSKPRNLKPRQIRRKQIWGGLASAAVLAIIVARCSSEDPERQANQPVDILFYQNTALCEYDVKQQWAEYEVSRKNWLKPDSDEDMPTAPPLAITDCAPQMLAAQQEHDKVAPVYATLEDCQSEGVKCESAPAGAAGYRPVYGGTYIDPYDRPSYVYVSYGGRQHRVFQSHIVYRSSSPGHIVTPYGRQLAQGNFGQVTVPRHTTFGSPSRPNGTAGRGTIRGRSSSGFGSSFKGTGSGGK
jgi:uncharacterized protein YgiB involved in biofilm formation